MKPSAQPTTRAAAGPTTPPTARAAAAPAVALPVPRVWTFDGPFERCLADLEDTLRRAIVGIGDVSRIALQIDLSLPALRRRVELGDPLQPAWTLFSARLAGYGLPQPPRVRRLRAPGPLATLVIAYRK